jgi:hypothetical protein
MWPNRRVIDLLKIEHPLISAPMAGVSTVKLAAAVRCAMQSLRHVCTLCGWWADPLRMDSPPTPNAVEPKQNVEEMISRGCEKAIADPIVL